MDMVRFTSDDDPDYRNVLSELQRLKRNAPHHPKEASHSASSEFSKSGGKHYNETRQGQFVEENEKATLPGGSSSTRPTEPLNTFSGTFNSGGGKSFLEINLIQKVVQ